MSRFWLLILPVRAQLAAQQFSCGSFLQKVQEKVQEAFTLQMQHNCNLTEKPGGGVLPIITYTGRLRQNGVPFSAVEVHERVAKSVILVRKKAQKG